jgi:hypothetical protein
LEANARELVAMNTKALVTLLIGDDYRRRWEKTFRGTMELYAEKHGYDIIALDRYLDASDFGRSRPPHWQKLLILEQPEVRRYEHAVWIDADILVNHHHAPCIVAAGGVSDKIGLVPYSIAEMGTPRRSDNRYHRRPQGGRSPAFAEWYRFYGIARPGERDVDDFTNTGVLVFKPHVHDEFLRWVYETGHEVAGAHQENGPLSYHIFRLGLANPLDERFNVSWNGEMAEHYPFLLARRNFEDRMLAGLCVNAAWNNAYFLHFVGASGRIHADLVFKQRASAHALEIVVAA